MTLVHLGIGSNLGDRRLNCNEAVARLGKLGVSVRKCSSQHDTEPWGVADQPRFINMAVEAETDLGPRELLAAVKHIERDMGRQQSVTWGPRIIDIDILLYDESIISDHDLAVPHPLMHTRDFVLRPLSEIAPLKVHPIFSRTILALLHEHENNSRKTDRVLVFGVGNPLYGDDGIGNELIGLLAGQYTFPESVRLIESGALSDLLDFIDDYRHIIIIDAMVAGKKPGEIVVSGLDELALPADALSHSTGFLEGLKNMKKNAEIRFVCIEPHETALGAGLSERISKKIPEMINIVLDSLRSLGVEPEKQ